MNKLLFFLCVAFCESYIQAQITPHSLFLVFDDTEGIIKTEKINIENGKENFCRTIHHYRYHKKVTEVMSKTKKTYDYFEYRFEKRNMWAVEMSHTLNGESPYAQYVLLLPKKLFSLYQLADRVKNIPEMEKFWDTLTEETFPWFFKNYEYIFDLRVSLEGKRFRNTIFMVFKSDLEKEHIPCYELSVITANIAAYNDLIDDEE